MFTFYQAKSLKTTDTTDTLSLQRNATPYKTKYTKLTILKPDKVTKILTNNIR